MRPEKHFFDKCFISVLTPSKSPEKQTVRAEKEKGRKRAESKEPQGFKGKTLIVENFFGLQGQEAGFSHLCLCNTYFYIVIGMRLTCKSGLLDCHLEPSHFIINVLCSK